MNDKEIQIVEEYTNRVRDLLAVTVIKKKGKVEIILDGGHIL